MTTIILTMSDPKPQAEVTITAPIEVIPSKSGIYGLIIRDFFGVEHYFNKDGTYDGWAKRVPITGEN